MVFNIFQLQNLLWKRFRYGVFINDGEISHFYFSVGDYYQIPIERIIVIKERYPIIIKNEFPIMVKHRGYTNITIKK